MFEEEEQLSEEDLKEMTAKLIERAESKKHSEAEIIKNFNVYKIAKILKKSTEQIADGFQAQAVAYYEEYLEKLKAGIDYIGLLINYRKFIEYANYYYEEVDNLNRSILDYKEYLLAGNLISSLFGKERDLGDFDSEEEEDE